MTIPGGQVQWGKPLEGGAQGLGGVGDQEVDTGEVTVLGSKVKGRLVPHVTEEGVSMALGGRGWVGRGRQVK